MGSLVLGQRLFPLRGGCIVVEVDEDLSGIVARVPYLATSARSLLRPDAPPMQAPATLCREFAELRRELSPQSVCAFASKYGCLGGAVQPSALSGMPVDECPDRGLMLVEPVSNWYEPVGEVALALDLLDRRESNPESLSGLISWKGSSPMLSSYDPFLLRGLSARVPRNDYQTAATLFAQQLINDGMVHATTSARLVFDPPMKRLRMSIQPTGTLGSIWLQVAALAEGRVQHRRCDGCLEWFEIEVGAERPDRRYCKPRGGKSTTTCRQRAFKRREAARAVQTNP